MSSARGRRAGHAALPGAPASATTRARALAHAHAHALALSLVLACLLGAVPAQAGPPAFPAKPIRIVVNFPAGGPLDLLGRLLAGTLSSGLHQPAIVENRTGAAGNIGAAAVARAEADGYTLLLSLDTVFSLNPLVYPRLPFDPDRDFAPIGSFAGGPMVLVVHPSLPVTDLGGLRTLAHTRRLTYSSAGPGSPGQLTFEYLLDRAGFAIDHVPYRGNAAAVSAIVAGEVDSGFIALAGAAAPIRAGRLRALAVSSPEPVPQFEQVPTVAQAGYPGFQVRFTNVLLAPAGTAPAVLAVLHGQLLRMMEDPEVLGRLSTMSLGRQVDAGEATRERILADRARWAPIVRHAHIWADQ